MHIGKGKKIFGIINKNQKEHMLLTVFLAIGRRKEPVLRIIVDHGFGENLVLGIPLIVFQTLIHKGGNLIHIEFYAGNGMGRDIGKIV